MLAYFVFWYFNQVSERNDLKSRYFVLICLKTDSQFNFYWIVHQFYIQTLFFLRKLSTWTTPDLKCVLVEIHMKNWFYEALQNIVPHEIKKYAQIDLLIKKLKINVKPVPGMKSIATPAPAKFSAPAGLYLSAHSRDQSICSYSSI